MSTKRLQEVLKLWSVEQATEEEVSNVYVQIGHEFNVTISAFAYHQIELRCVGLRPFTVIGRTAYASFSIFFLQ